MVVFGLHNSFACKFNSLISPFGACFDHDLGHYYIWTHVQFSCQNVRNIMFPTFTILKFQTMNNIQFKAFKKYPINDYSVYGFWGREYGDSYVQGETCGNEINTRPCPQQLLVRGIASTSKSFGGVQLVHVVCHGVCIVWNR